MRRLIGPDIPTPDYDDPKEMYAFFGLAAFCAGLLEQSLLNLYAAARAAQLVPVQDVQTAELFDEADSKTLGRLFAGVKERLRVKDSTRRTLEEAARRRNYLIHHFFREHAITQMEPGAKRKMIDELRELALLFRSADEIADPLWRRAWDLLGVTRAQLDAQLDTIKREIQWRG